MSLDILQSLEARGENEDLVRPNAPHYNERLLSDGKGKNPVFVNNPQGVYS